MKLHIYKTNRRIRESPFLTACKEKDGLLGNIEMNHYTFIDDIDNDLDIKVDIGSNVKVYSNAYYVRSWEKYGDELNKPGVFDKLFKHFKK